MFAPVLPVTFLPSVPAAVFCLVTLRDAEAASSSEGTGGMESGALLLTWKLTDPITVKLLIYLLRSGIIVGAFGPWITLALLCLLLVPTLTEAPPNLPAFVLRKP